MKKTTYMILFVALSGLLLIGYFYLQNNNVELEFADGSHGVNYYMMDIETQDENAVIPELELDRNNKTFSITHDILSSTVIGGTYRIKNNMLIAETYDKKSTYQFKIVDSKTLKFIQSKSSKIELTDETVGVMISDGSRFRLQE